MRTTPPLHMIVVGLGLLALSGAAACSDDPAAPSDTGDTTGGDGTAGDTAGDSGTASDTADTGAPPATPILERQGNITVTCSETLAPTQPADREWFVNAVADIGGAAWVLRSTFDSLFLTAVGTDGVLGSEWELGLDAYAMGSGAILADGPVAHVVWVEALDNGGQQLRHAVVDTGKGVQVAAHTLTGTAAAAVGAPTLLAAGEEVVIVWSSTDDGGQSTLHFGKLDAAGAFVGAPVAIATTTSAWNGMGAGVVALPGGGYAVAWGARREDDTNEVQYATVDADGTIVLPARRISPAPEAKHAYGEGWLQGVTPMLAVGDDVWVVFTESYFNGSFSAPEGFVDLHVAIVDAAGDAVVHRLGRTEVDKNNTDASLYRVGDAVALTWTHGTAIYICAGCFVDYDIKTVLIDPVSVTPRSAVATHTHNAHGYRRPRPVVLGPDILTLATQDFHALSYPAVAVMRCGAAE